MQAFGSKLKNLCSSASLAFSLFSGQSSSNLSIKSKAASSTLIKPLQDSKPL